MFITSGVVCQSCQLVKPPAVFSGSLPTEHMAGRPPARCLALERATGTQFLTQVMLQITTVDSQARHECRASDLQTC